MASVDQIQSSGNRTFTGWLAPAITNTPATMRAFSQEQHTVMDTTSLAETITGLHAALHPESGATVGHQRYAARAIRRLGLTAGLDRDQIDLLMAGAGTDTLLALLAALPRDQIHLALDGACIRRG